MTVKFLVLCCLLAICEAQLSRYEKQEVLDEHNRLRCKVARGEIRGQPAAANMVLLRWDDRPARTAQSWANRCVVGHNNNRGTFSSYRYVGENAAFWTNSYKNLRGPVKSWFDEHKDYNFNNKQCNGAQCGHYTQVVWADSTVVGCGRSKRCRGAYRDMMFCDYAPGGNFNNNYAYKVGKACSKCPGGYTKCLEGCCARPEDCRGDKRCTNSQVDDDASVELYPQRNRDNIKVKVSGPGKQYKYEKKEVETKEENENGNNNNSNKNYNNQNNRQLPKRPYSNWSDLSKYVPSNYQNEVNRFFTNWNPSGPGNRRHFSYSYHWGK